MRKLREMHPSEFRDLLAIIGIRQVDAARLLGVSDRMVRNYARGDYAPPAAVAHLLRLMAAKGVMPEELELL